ncbi:MAG: diphthine synthase [Candidatus Heimdallarchaeota archaeon]
MSGINYAQDSHHKDTELVFVGLGLVGFKSCSLETLEVLQTSDIIFLEDYTNFILREIPPPFQDILKKTVTITRKELEEDDEKFFKRIRGLKVVLLIPGDPFIATTHISLRISAEEKGINYRIIHNTSILSAAISASGLSPYRFGRTVTCPFPQNPSEHPYNIIKNNQQIRAHTLLLLDINPVSGEFVSIDQALSMLLDMEHKNQEGLIRETSLAIGLARLGYKDVTLAAGTIQQLIDRDWNAVGPPQCIIIIDNELHFAEKQTLKTVWKIQDDLNGIDNEKHV